MRLSVPIIGLCLSGTSQAQINAALRIGKLPHLERIMSRNSFFPMRPSPTIGSFSCIVATQMPTDHLPNIASIATGVSAKEHGVNCHSQTLRVPTIFSKLAASGVNVNILSSCPSTANILSDGLPSSNFVWSPSRGSSRSVNDQLLDVSAQAIESEMSRNESSLWFIATSDQLSHQCVPDDQQVYFFPPSVLVLTIVTVQLIDFYHRVDSMVGKLDAFGCVVGITSDHGISEKFSARGANVVLLKPLLDHCLNMWLKSDVIDDDQINCVDSIWTHDQSQSGFSNFDTELMVSFSFPSSSSDHSQLGSFAFIHVDQMQPAIVVRRLGGSHNVKDHELFRLTDVEHQQLCYQLLQRIRKHRFIYSALSQKDACDAMDLHPANSGNLVVVSQDWSVCCDSQETAQRARLPRNYRSHGGLSENTVPLIINRALKPNYQQMLNRGKGRNFMLFDILLNGIQS